MIQTITIDVTVPDGHEATGEYRKPSIGELFLTMAGTACVCSTNHQTTETRIILRKKWALPDWFRPTWTLTKSGMGYVVWRAGNANGYDAKLFWFMHDDNFVPPPEGTRLPVCKT